MSLSSSHQESEIFISCLVSDTCTKTRGNPTPTEAILHTPPTQVSQQRPLAQSHKHTAGSSTRTSCWFCSHTLSSSCQCLYCMSNCEQYVILYLAPLPNTGAVLSKVTQALCHQSRLQVWCNKASNENATISLGSSNLKTLIS